MIIIDLKDGDYLVDLGDPSARQDVIARVGADHPEIDGLITCAGVASQFPQPDKILQINYFGSVDLIEGLAPLIRPGGRIVAISSNSAPPTLHRPAPLDARRHLRASCVLRHRERAREAPCLVGRLR